MKSLQCNRVHTFYVSVCQVTNVTCQVIYLEKKNISNVYGLEDMNRA